ncbi:MAG: carboxypeptidase regulatory-like domain-containing protein, partial [Acidobacteria bacterium]|nr:carboxypeptidase regulatory-like domain-containing protein [Acidobacteriota bacterium]
MRVALCEICRGKSLERIGFLVLLSIAILVPRASAQEAVTGTIAGKVLSITGIPLADAKITMTNKSTGQTIATRTDAQGSFT